MTKKHFKAIAKVIEESAGRIPETERFRLAIKLSNILLESNLGFDREKFLTACGG